MRAGVIVSIEVALTVAIGQAGCSFTPAGGGGIDARPRPDGAPSTVDADLGPPRVVELAAGDAFTCARHSSGEVKCWGRGSSGQLGQGTTEALGNGPGELGAALPPLALGGPARDLAVGWRHACAVVARGGRDEVVCWGNNDNGKLGLGDTTPRGDTPGELIDAVVPLSTPSVAVAAGIDHTCALDAVGAVRCWGKNEVGQLGRDDTVPVGDGPGQVAALEPILLPLAVPADPIAEVTAGDDHTCVRTRAGKVACWGDGGEGELGQGSNANIGAMPGQMANLGAVAVGGPGAGAGAVSVGDDLSCALRLDGAVTCWGRASEGRLGLERPGGEHQGDMPGELPLPPITLPGLAESVSAGRGGHACVVVGGGAYCWGDGRVGQLGNDRGDVLGDMVGEMAMVTMAPITLAGPVQQIAPGLDHTCALLRDGRVQCWGSNGSGQLGAGDMVQRGDAAGEMAALGVVDLGW
ncbi:MAG: hypothetical protein KBG28_22500 [Kofleriaceae bacterium]|nr:hypothetical protein [Kofleriaceae bacterium]MBP9206761.1 hypothetical protein [Kofleriaceae bacterium]